MQLITFYDMSSIFGWRGHAAFFNSKQYGFPQPVSQNNSGDNLYSLEEVVQWDKERPLKPHEGTTLPGFKAII